MQNNIKHIVRLAQQQALSSFAELVAHMLVESKALIGDAVRSAPATEQAALHAASYWLTEKERLFRQVMLAKFTTLLERAMETMHTDLRAGLHDFSADSLSLVDDDVMTRQVELDRLAVRLRDVDEMSLGRINLMIANLHGVSKVRERENPFRPYLLARALYESVREMAKDTAMAKVLFEHLAVAMANRLPGYYAAILGNFEARGLDARLLAQPSEMTPAQRERLNAQYAAGGGHVHGLQELVRQVLHERGTAPRHLAAGADEAGVTGITGTSGVSGGSGQAARPPHPQRSWLNAHLRQLQHADYGAGDGATAASAAPAPLVLAEQLAEKADPHSRVTMDLVGLAFDYIAHEALLHGDMRAVLLRLHVPFLRAAVLDPQLLQEHGHPARSLLDRLGTLAAAMQAEAGGLRALPGAAARLIDQLRQQFDADCAVFATAERELDSVVAAMLAHASPLYTRLGEAVEAADVSGARVQAAQAALAALLAPLRLDTRLATFIDTVWTPVMLRAGGGGVIDASLLPELIWSTQEKVAPDDRAMLMRALPDLVRRIRAGIALLDLPPAEASAALDQLVAIHMDVLGQRLAPGGLSTGLDWLHLHFGPLAPEAAGTPAASAAAADVLAPPALEAALAQADVPAVVYGEPAWRESLPVDQEWLLRARPGASFETLVDGQFIVVRLETVSADHGVFIFSAPAPALPLVYRKHALLAAIDGGALRPVEYAPLFERAVSAAMAGLAAPPG